MKKNILFLTTIFALGALSCATAPTHNDCGVRILRSGSDFSPKIKNISGDQILFTIGIEGTSCTSSEIDQFSEDLFEKYAKEHGYTDFKILERLPDKIAAYRYVVVFSPVKREPALTRHCTLTGNSERPFSKGLSAFNASYRQVRI